MITTLAIAHIAFLVIHRCMGGEMGVQMVVEKKEKSRRGHPQLGAIDAINV
jgi:hypothetical protein